MFSIHPFRALKTLAQGLLEDTDSNHTLALDFERRSADGRHAEQAFLLHGDLRFDYPEANRCVNRVAHAYREMGLEKGDVVALMMENRPEFLWHYLAAGKLGAVVALLNTQARGDGLLHALSVSGASYMTVGSECLPALAAVKKSLPQPLAANFYVDVAAGSEATDPALLPHFAPSACDTNPPETSQHCLGDTGAYIFTSGTTGLPKAAIMNYQRLTAIGRVLGAVAWRLKPGDVIYNCLPLFHSNALLLAVSSVIAHGATLALARRFSAHGFWADIRRHRATGFNYIGEMCRYLSNMPVGDLDGSHEVRIIIGQGLQTDVWNELKNRFAIPRIVELYASTEGNIATMNLGGEIGSVGKLRFGGRLARWDLDRGDFARDAEGRLVPGKPGETGVLLGPIRKRTPFAGYRDADATRAKVVRNAFREGDVWYNTGDLFRMDDRRNLFFVDRIGDTFRWKGENVATTYVQEQLTRWPAVSAASVYGVAVPRCEGRAGMAAIVLRPGESFDAAGLAAHVDTALPSHARPVFVRIRKALETTATLKLQKSRLQKEAFALELDEPIYVRGAGRDSYERLTPELHAAITSGDTRL